MVQLSFILSFFLFSFASAFDSVQMAHHYRLRHADIFTDSLSSVLATSTLSLSSSVLPSLTPDLASPTSSFTSSSSIPTQSISTSTPPSSPSTTSTPPSSLSSVALPSSTSAFSTASTSAVTPTLSPTSAPVAVEPQPSSSSVTFLNGAGAPTQISSASTVVLTLTTATPSSTPTQSSSQGFFSNTGAVAGTFTVVGLIGVAGVIAVVLLIARRRHSRSFEEDAEYLDKSPDLFADPSITHVASVDDGSASDHAHYGAPPMALATPPTAYYPDHAYALHPQVFLPEAHPPPGPHGYPSPYPVASAHDYAAQRIYSPEDYNIAYPPLDFRDGTNMPNLHGITDVEPDSAPVPQTQTALPSALRPSVMLTPSAPKQSASTRFSVDSFYAGIATDAPPTPGKTF